MPASANRTGYLVGRRAAHLRSVLCLFLLATASAGAQLSPLASRAATGPTGPLPDVRIVYFGSDTGFAIRSRPIDLLCVVRNVGPVSLPPATLQLHCVPLSGLDYTSGDTLPEVPALRPDESAAVRWRLMPTGGSAPLIAAALMEPLRPSLTTPSASLLRQVAVANIPERDHRPEFGAPIAGVDAGPRAGSAGKQWWIASNRIALRMLPAADGGPILVVAARSGTSWQACAVGAPLCRIQAAALGQTPWWRHIIWISAQASSDAEAATLTVLGHVGKLWSATMRLTARQDSGALDAVISLTPKAAVMCQAVQLPVLHAPEELTLNTRADGKPILLSDPAPLYPDSERVSADRSAGGTTYGVSWADAGPLPDWTWKRLPRIDSAAPLRLGAAWIAPGTGSVIAPGSSMMLRFRIFAFSPSDTVKDALRFVLP